MRPGATRSLVAVADRLKHGLATCGRVARLVHLPRPHERGIVPRRHGRERERPLGRGPEREHRQPARPPHGARPPRPPPPPPAAGPPPPPAPALPCHSGLPVSTGDSLQTFIGS